ncbi:class A beta-lactamase-related serine hydrolase [Hymenobacter weizhouensis]|uniref:class A beta-lactamase-related serine hydrolase n=1 Tax=Hymenobacter sp. YIM 151500-1 TaxID=2987689 RepID=UPI002227A3B9|nr:class A beta-lactamase-related serine hydrolase [Hymenobacter sp. YIM 151500-1]UYZ63427.1 class A beta-lactamase-related serine hydrolase [Hymenobacter sp. YIM 151500-1]
MTTSLLRLLAAVLALGIWTSEAWAQSGAAWRRQLRQDSVLGPVLRQPAQHRVQILYTRIRRDAQGRPHFRSFRYRVRPREYFYPASAIKLPAAVVALEKLRGLSQQVPGLTPESPLRIDSAAWGQTRVVRDTSSATGRASVAQYVRKLLLVSDNDAYNRLYEFVGPQDLQVSLRRCGLRHTVLRHRLSVGDQDSTARRTNPVAFYADTALTRPLYVQPAATFTGSWPRRRLRGLGIGTAYMKGEQRINEPLDFSQKNVTSLPDLQRVLRAVLFPESLPPRRRFQLAPADYTLLRDYLHRLPRQSRHPRYSPQEFPDNYAKFLLVGSAQPAPLPAGVRIYNKIGQAYGFLIDNAYVADSARRVEFLLSAVVYVNADGVLNDDQYEYNTVGLPFLRRLGQLVYEAELRRAGRFVAQKPVPQRAAGE